MRQKEVEEPVLQPGQQNLNETHQVLQIWAAVLKEEDKGSGEGGFQEARRVCLMVKLVVSPQSSHWCGLAAGGVM